MKEFIFFFSFSNFVFAGFSLQIDWFCCKSERAAFLLSFKLQMQMSIRVQ